MDSKSVRTVSGTGVCLLCRRSLDKAPGDRMGLLGCPVRGQELNPDPCGSLPAQDIP